MWLFVERGVSRGVVEGTARCVLGLCQEVGSFFLLTPNTRVAAERFSHTE